MTGAILKYDAPCRMLAEATSFDEVRATLGMKEDLKTTSYCAVKTGANPSRLARQAR